VGDANQCRISFAGAEADEGVNRAQKKSELTPWQFPQAIPDKAGHWEREQSK
jgi:hypothetical protein